MKHPTCPRCSRELTEVVVWEVSTLDEISHKEARGDCEIHGSMHVRSTKHGGWLEIRRP